MSTRPPASPWLDKGIPESRVKACLPREVDGAKFIPWLANRMGHYRWETNVAESQPGTLAEELQQLASKRQMIETALSAFRPESYSLRARAAMRDRMDHAPQTIGFADTMELGAAACVSMVAALGALIVDLQRLQQKMGRPPNLLRDALLVDVFEHLAPVRTIARRWEVTLDVLAQCGVRVALSERQLRALRSTRRTK